MTYYVTGMFLHLSFLRFYWLMLAVAAAAAIITLRESADDAGGSSIPAAWSVSSGPSST
jgi:hypothetical protein